MSHFLKPNISNPKFSMAKKHNTSMNLTVSYVTSASKAQFCPYLQLSWAKSFHKHLCWRNNLCNHHRNSGIGSLCIAHWKYASKCFIMLHQQVVMQQFKKASSNAEVGDSSWLIHLSHIQSQKSICLSL